MKKKLWLFNVPFLATYFTYSYFCFGMTIQFFLFSKSLHLISFLCWEDRKTYKTQGHTDKSQGKVRSILSSGLTLSAPKWDTRGFIQSSYRI